MATKETRIVKTRNAGTKILIVDDTPKNIQVLGIMLKADGFNISVAQSGEEALEVVGKVMPDLILLDYMMPGLNGYEVLSRLKGDLALRHIPVVMVSALDEVENVIRCIENGADDYLTKPFNAALLKARISNCLAKKVLHDQQERLSQAMEDYSNVLDSEVERQSKALLDRAKEIASTQLSLIFALAKLAESRDPETGEHLNRVSEYCKAIARHLSKLPKHKEIIDNEFIETIAASSPLHDIGKVGVSDNILLKPGKLTDDEFALMKAHSLIGANTLKEVEKRHPGNKYITMGKEIAECHHEKWDGTGYPRRLAGEQIPLSARIMALGDVYDALTSKRCYKEEMPHGKAAAIIRNGKGTHFDPDVVDAFSFIEEEFKKIRIRWANSK